MALLPVELEVREGRIELLRYAPEATLADLRDAVEATRSCRLLVTSHCAGCGRCCHFEHLPLFGFDLLEMRARRSTRDLSPWLDYPERPSLSERSESIEELMREHGVDHRVASLLYEYNVAEPITYSKVNGACVFLENGFCGNYEGRAYTCSLYACTMGESLMSLQERIVRQGVWHSYLVEGWIPAEAIPHNPFLTGEGYGSVRIEGFDVDLSGALESLFFYF